MYTDAAETGMGVVDMMDVRAARKETAQWKHLTQWVDDQSVEQSGATVASLRMKMRPRAAQRKPAADDTAQALEQ